MKANELLSWRSAGVLLLIGSPLSGFIPYWLQVENRGNAALASWLVIIGVFVAGLLLTGRALDGDGDPLCFLRDKRRNRYSLSRLQLAGWSVIILSGVGALWLGNFHAGAEATAALDVAIPPEVLALLGITVASAVGSGIVKTAKAQAPTDRQAASAIQAAATIRDANIAASRVAAEDAARDGEEMRPLPGAEDVVRDE